MCAGAERTRLQHCVHELVCRCVQAQNTPDCSIVGMLAMMLGRMAFPPRALDSRSRDVSPAMALLEDSGGREGKRGKK